RNLVAPAVITARDEHPAIRQKRRLVKFPPRGVKATCSCPGAGGWIVEFRAIESDEVNVRTACGEHLAVGQQRRCLGAACSAEAAGGRPSPSGRIVELGARNKVVTALLTARDEHQSVRQQRRCVKVACDV